MRFAMIGVLAIAGLYLALVAGMFVYQRQLLYFPGRRAPLPAEAGFADATQHVLTAADGTRVVLWHAPAAEGAATVLYFQGNGGEIADRPQRWAAYRAAGLGVAFLSYRGFGGSDGSPSETGLHMDADAAHDWLVAAGVPAGRIAVVGESLGTGVAVRLAAARQVGALVLEAPYTSTADVAAEVYPWLPVRLLMRDPFPSADRIGAIKVPLFILHGDRDATIPLKFGQRLYDLAPQPKEFHLIAGQGHEALYQPQSWAMEIAFIARVLPPG